jgi:hypothetical protein
MRRVALDDEDTLASDKGSHQLLSLFENSTVGIAVADPTFRFLSANPAFLASRRFVGTHPVKTTGRLDCSLG